MFFSLLAVSCGSWDLNFPTRDQTGPSTVKLQSPNHWTAREFPKYFQWCVGVRWHNGKKSACQCRRHKWCHFHLWVKKIPWSRKWQPTPLFLPGESHGQRSLGGCRGLQELDTTEHAAYWSGKTMGSWFVCLFVFSFSLLLKDKLSCIKSFKSLFKQKLIQTRQHPGQWRLEEPAIWNERFSRQKRARGRSYPGQESRLWVPSGDGEDYGAGDWWGFLPGKAEPIIRSCFGREA